MRSIGTVALLVTLSSSAIRAAEQLPTVSVVAPTYRRCHALPAFVEPLLAQGTVAELVIAVDGSGDGSVDWLRDRARDDPRLVVLDLPNGGAGAARQAGVEAARGEVILLMDDDVIAEPGLVVGHARHHSGLTPRLVLGYMPNDWRSLPPGRRGVAWVYRDAYERHCRRYLTDPEFVLHGLWGGNLSMPREHLLRVGIQKLDVKRGQDDREFGLRCFKAGVEGVFDPELRGLHLYDRDIAAYRSDARIQGESRRLIHEVHPDLVGDGLVDRAQGSEVADGVGLGLPEPLRNVWRRLAQSPLFSVAAKLLDLLFAAGVRTRHLGLEAFAARGLGSLETARGVAEGR